VSNIELLKAMGHSLDGVTIPTAVLFDAVCIASETTNLARARVKTLCRVGAFDQAAIELLEVVLPDCHWGRDPHGYVRLWMRGDNVSGPGNHGLDSFALALLRVMVAALIAEVEPGYA